MTSETVKATPLTNLDSTPVVQNTVGEGAPGFLRSVGGTVTNTTAYVAPCYYKLARVPSCAHVKHVYVGVDATVSTLTANIGWYYSDSTVDGTTASNQGTAVNSTTGEDLYGSAVSALNTAGFNDYVNTAGGAVRNEPVWQACGLTSDPGGFFDLTLTTTATNSGAAIISGEVQFVL